MKQLTTQAIILTRTNYGEADRILTLLTPEYGKLRLMAKGVRKVKSKMAGGIELFSVSDISFIRGRGEIGTLTSTRLVKHYGNIVKDIERTTAGYELIRQLHRATEDAPDTEYFQLIEQAFEALNEPEILLELIRLWFAIRLLKLDGHMPNLQTDQSGQALQLNAKYNFDVDDGGLIASPNGQLSADEIKFLRLGFSGNTPQVLSRVEGSEQLVQACLPLIQAMTRQFIR